MSQPRPKSRLVDRRVCCRVAQQLGDGGVVPSGIAGCGEDLGPFKSGGDLTLAVPRSVELHGECARLWGLTAGATEPFALTSNSLQSRLGATSSQACLKGRHDRKKFEHCAAIGRLDVNWRIERMNIPTFAFGAIEQKQQVERHSSEPVDT